MAAAIVLGLTPYALAALSDGRLDLGSEGLPVPDPIVVNQTSPRTAALLSEVLRAETVPVRRVQFLHDLGETRLPGALPGVIAALGDSDAAVRTAAAEALALLASPDPRAQASRQTVMRDSKATGRLKELLLDPDPRMRFSAMRALAMLDPDCDALRAALAGADTAMLSAAIDLASVPAQGRILSQRLDTVPGVLRPRAIVAVGRCGTPDAVPQLTRIAAAETPLAQVQAVATAMGLLKSADAVPPLRELLRHRHSVVRREAMAAVGQCASEDMARDLATEMLGDGDPTVRQAAAAVLGRHLVAQSVTELAKHLGDGYEPLWRTIRDALASAAPGPTRDTVIQAAGGLLDSPDPRRREDGSYLLGRFRSDYRYADHLEQMSDHDPQLAAQAVESLGLIGRQEARAGIVALAKVAITPEAGDRAQAANNALAAAGRLGADEALPDCIRVLAGDPRFTSGRARSGAAFTIGMVAKADSPAIESLFLVLSNPIDGAKFEAIKAMGNLRLPGAMQRAATYPLSGHYTVQWITEWATARITGEPERHLPNYVPWVADTSIRDLAAPQP